jgi:hypothetical protein
MDFMLIFSVLILVILAFNAFLLVQRMKAAPEKPVGKGIGLAIGLAMGLALWLPLGYATGSQEAGVILGSAIGILAGAALEIAGRRQKATP